MPSKRRTQKCIASKWDSLDNELEKDFSWALDHLLPFSFFHSSLRNWIIFVNARNLILVSTNRRNHQDAHQFNKTIWLMPYGIYLLLSVISPRMVITLWPSIACNFIWKVESKTGRCFCLILRFGAFAKVRSLVRTLAAFIMQLPYVNTACHIHLFFESLYITWPQMSRTKYIKRRGSGKLNENIQEFIAHKKWIELF